MQLRKLIVSADGSNWRLDQYLTQTGIWPSRSFIQKIIEAGGVKSKGQMLRPSYRLTPGDELEITWEDPEPLDARPEKIPVEILYEDSDLVVVNKPRGMVVHPAAGNLHGTLVNALLHHCSDLSGIGGVVRPGIVHRLDKDTSGILVVAKNDLSHLSLADQLKHRTMIRLYKVLVHGHPPPDGRVDAPIGRHPVERKKMAVILTGKPAVTNFRVLEYFGPSLKHPERYAFLEVRLETGRTHQIRVHLSYLGFPVVGDEVYGLVNEAAPIRGQALHAAVLGFSHPRSGEKLEFSTDIPTEMQRVMDWCRGRFT